MSHAIHTPKTSACITLQAMMIDPHPPAERLRIAAQFLDAALDAGEYARLASHQLVSLRGLVWMMDETAEQLDSAEMAARPVRARAGWLARWFA
tara:strand:+ start:1050 stop:1331 length:282 start_codon:yes stop_codon:yes gene_type:complete